jgi:signal transduction histidine kinase
MKKNLTAISMYIFLNLIFFLLIISSVVTLDHEQKNNIADATISLIRENFLVTDFRTVSRDVEKVKSNNFSKVIVYDKNNKEIINSTEKYNFFNIKIKKYIWVDENLSHLKGKVVFFVGIDHLFLISLKILFGTFFITAPVFIIINNFLSRRHAQLIENENAKFIAKVTRQMSHDIRSPIATLQQLSEKFKEFTTEDVKLLKSSLERIDEIANSHLNDSRGTFLQVVTLNNLTELITELTNEKKVEFPSLEINLSLQDSAIKCAAGDFKRVLSNLINNSYESIKSPFPKIKISTLKRDQEIIVRIEDNGVGFPQDVLKKLGTSLVTTKKNGNGLGLKHAIETLAEWDSQLNIIFTGKAGTVIEINFPLNANTYVLIDDDELTRLTWETKATQSKLELKTFKSIGEFDLSKDFISKDAFIYIDSDLGNDIKGEKLALVLHNEGYRNISMATGFGSDSFTKLTFLKSVISKKAPF